MKFILKSLLILSLILSSFNAVASISKAKEIIFSIIEKDKCNRIDLLKAEPIIIITATCSPKKNKWFFDLWKSNEKIFAFTKAYTKLIDTNDFPNAFNFEEIMTSKQIILRKKTYKRKYPKIIIYDENIYLKILKYSKKNQNFEFLLSSSNIYSLLTFQIKDKTKSPVSYDIKKISNIKKIRNTNAVILPYFNLLNIVKIDDTGWKCSLQKPEIEKYKFLKVWLRDNFNNDINDCWYRIIYKKTKVKHHSVLEKLAWYLIKQVNLKVDKIDTNKNKLFSFLSNKEKISLKNFISHQLLEFSSNKNYATQSIYKILKVYFKDDIKNLYISSLNMNCSSFSKKIINHGQKKVDYYSQKLSLEQVAKARFIFYLNRKLHFPNFGYARGTYGIIGNKQNYDYCINLNTEIDYFITNEPYVNSVKSKFIFANSFLNIIEINKELTKKQLTYTQKTELLEKFKKKLTFFENDKKYFNSLQSWYFYLISLINFSDDRFSESIINWKKYIKLKYEKTNYNLIERSDAQFTIKILSKIQKREKNEGVSFFESHIRSFASNFVFGHFLKTGIQNINYYDDFNFIENDLEIIDEIQLVLKDLYKFDNVDDLIFKLLQKKKLTAESLSLTRFFTIPQNYIVKKNIAELLLERKNVIKSFYKQMINFTSSSVNERDKLQYFTKVIENNKKTFFPSKNSTLEELFTSGAVVLPEGDNRNQILISSLIHLYNFESKVKKLKDIKPSYYGLEQIKFENFNANLALSAFENLKKLDKNIMHLDKDVYEIITNKGLSIKNVQNSIKSNEALIFISQNSINQHYTTYTITNKKYKISNHKNSAILKKCLKEFESVIINQQYQEDECNISYKKIFFTNEAILGSKVTNIKYIVEGEIKKVPPTLIYKDLTSLKNKKKNSNQNIKSEIKRGIAKKDNYKNLSPNLQLNWYWQKYNFILYPSFNLIKVIEYLQKYEIKNNNIYLGVAVSKVPSFPVSKNNIINQLSLEDIPQTKIEVENNSKIWGLKKSKILLNEDANIINLKSFFKDIHPKIFSIGTHTVKSIKKDKSQEDVLLLYPNPGETIDESYLTPKKIENNNFSADLVILSSCKTMETENNFSRKNNLASSFLINGSKSILVTYWQIEDISTRIFMNTFFTKISNQKTKYSDALKFGIETLIKKGYDHPFYWAPFTIMGHSN